MSILRICKNVLRQQVPNNNQQNGANPSPTVDKLRNANKNYCKYFFSKKFAHLTMKVASASLAALSHSTCAPVTRQIAFSFAPFMPRIRSTAFVGTTRRFDLRRSQSTQRVSYSSPSLALRPLLPLSAQIAHLENLQLFPAS